MTNAMTYHSDEEVLAAFVDGQLTGEELQTVTSHLAECEECRMSIGEAAAFQEEQEPKRESRRSWWLAAAAAVAAAVLAVPGYQWWDLNNSQGKLWTAEAANDRPAGRLSGQTPYAPLHRIMRSGEKTQLPLDVDSATSTILGKFGNDQSQAARRLIAAAQAARETTPASAIATLTAIPETKRDAATWNDLAALQSQDPALRRDALASVEQALEKRPNMPEALFNRAVILKKLNDSGAPAAINAYLAVDPNSGWAEELKRKDPFE
jgi:hypothetical protein